MDGSKWDESKFVWYERMFKHKDMGIPFNNLLLVEATPDFQNTSNFVIGISEASLGVEKDLTAVNHYDDDYTNGYFKLIMDIARLLGAEVDTKLADEDIFQMVNFEIAIGDLLMTKEEKRQLTKNYKKMKVSELKEYAPGVSFFCSFVLLTSDPFHLTHTLMYPVDPVDQYNTGHFQSNRKFRHERHRPVRSLHQATGPAA